MRISGTEPETETGAQAQGGTRTGYRAVLAEPGSRLWYAAAVCARAPVVMAPLALVFAGYAAGSFTLGGVLAAGYALGEAAAAPLLGRLFDTRRFVPLLRWTLGLNAGLFVVLALAVAHAPAVVLILLAAAAGASGSGAPGGMRAQLTATVPEALRAEALSLDTVVAQAVRALAPPLVSGLYVAFSARGAVLGMAAFAVVPVLVARRIPHQNPDLVGAVQDVRATGDEALGDDDLGDEALGNDAPGDGAPGARDASPLTLPAPPTSSASPTSRPPLALPALPALPIQQILRLSWPTALLSAAVMFLVGTADILLPARLAATGSGAALSGPILTAFAVAAIAAGLYYGTRTWPGGASAQTLALTLLMAAALTLPGLTREPAVIAVAFAVAGLAYAPVLTIRNLALQQQLPPSAWATGFSILYAAAGAGYGAAGLLAAALLDTVGTGPAFPVCTGAATVICVTALFGERAAR